MQSVSSSTQTQLLYHQRTLPRSRRRPSPWNEFHRRWLRRHWLAPATLLALLGAVAAPGGLQSEFFRYIPLSYIYFAAGRNYRPIPRDDWWRHLLICTVHSHVIGPVAVAVVLAACRHVVDERIIQGMLLCAVGRPCGWLSVGASPSPRAAPLVCGLHVSALLAQPLATLLICGRASVPPIGEFLRSAILALPPYAMGAFLNKTYTRFIISKIHNFCKQLCLDTRNNISNVEEFSTLHQTKQINSQNFQNSSQSFAKNQIIENEDKGSATTATSATSTPVKFCVLLLLHAEFSARLDEASGSLYVGDVIGTMVLVLCCVCADGLACYAYYASGATSAKRARLVTLVALPRCLDVGWHSSPACYGAGLSRLPAVFVAPLHALALALALATVHGHADDG